MTTADGAQWIDDLVVELVSIDLMDKVKLYDERNQNIIKAVWVAQKAGLAAGFRFDSAEPEWPVAFIELPTGQVSWHLPQHVNAWDGHSTEDKYKRLRDFVEDHSEELE